MLSLYRGRSRGKNTDSWNLFCFFVVLVFFLLQFKVFVYFFNSVNVMLMKMLTVHWNLLWINKTCTSSTNFTLPKQCSSQFRLEKTTCRGKMLVRYPGAIHSFATLLRLPISANLWWQILWCRHMFSGKWAEIFDSFHTRHKELFALSYTNENCPKLSSVLASVRLQSVNTGEIGVIARTN